jgi:hypothetical protein
VPHDPFYLDWKFWSAVIAVIALVASQFPPVLPRLWRGRLAIEVNSRIVVGHKVGNTNVSMYVGLTNAGGRALRVRAITLRLKRDGKELTSLPAKNFHEKAGDKDSVLFVPFSLKREESWAHIVNFLNFFDRQTEKHFRESERAMRASIGAKLKARPSSDQDFPVSAEPALVAPFLAMFDQMFVLDPGEYIAELVVSTPEKETAFKKAYRFTLYESDTEEMKRQRDDYHLGAGVYFDPLIPPISVALSEHAG